MNVMHFKSVQNLFFLKDTVKILSSPHSIFLGACKIKVVIQINSTKILLEILFLERLNYLFTYYLNRRFAIF